MVITYSISLLAGFANKSKYLNQFCISIGPHMRITTHPSSMRIGFNRIENNVDFRFEYGKNLGMFCTEEKHPYPHKHLPHALIGEKID